MGHLRRDWYGEEKRGGRLDARRVRERPRHGWEDALFWFLLRMLLGGGVVVGEGEEAFRTMDKYKMKKFGKLGRVWILTCLAV